MSKHQLISAGAAFNQLGERLFSNTTSGFGSALCSCGWLSAPVEYGRSRKAAHKAHVAMYHTEVENTISHWGEDTADAEYYEPTPGIVFVRTPEDASYDELVKTAEPAPEDAAVRDEAPLPESFPVLWPESVAKLFFRALAKDGAQILVDSCALERKCNESKMELSIVGHSDEAWIMSMELPSVFMAANIALKKWRKMSPDYKRFSLKTSDGRRDAFAAEQRFLRDFCYAVAGTFSQDMLASDGVQAGLLFVNEGDVL